MTRILGALSVLVLVFGFASVAVAESHLFPAQNEGACTAVGGVFSQTSSTRTCTVEYAEYVEGVVVTRPAGKSGLGWTLELSQEVTYRTVYTRDGSDLTTVGPTLVASGAATVTRCWNPAGKEFHKFDNPNCRP